MNTQVMTKWTTRQEAEDSIKRTVDLDTKAGRIGRRYRVRVQQSPRTSLDLPWPAGGAIYIVEAK